MKTSARYTLELLLLISLYFVAAKLGFELAYVNPSVTAVWAPTGIALATLIIFGYRLWPGIFFGAFIANITTFGALTAGPLIASLGVATGNTLEAILGAYLIRHFANGRNAFDRPSDILKFLVIVGTLPTMTSATIGVTSLMLGGLAEWSLYGAMWFTWWLGDLGGAAIVTPAIMLWMAPSNRVAWSRAKRAEAVILFGLLILADSIIFNSFFSVSAGNYPVGFLALPLLVWISIQFSQRAVALAVMVILAIAVWGNVQGYGPYVAGRLPGESLLTLQAFFIVASMTGQAIAATAIKFKEAEQSLKKAYQESISANLAKDEFLATLAHELRNPLAPMLSSIEFLELSDNPDRALQQPVAMLKRQTNNIVRLVDDLLDISRLERGTITLRKETTDIRSVLTHAAETTKSTLEVHNHHLQISVPDTPLWLETDPLRLEQVFINLINNAARYAHTNSSIWVDCQHKGDEIVTKFWYVGKKIEPKTLQDFFEASSIGTESTSSRHQDQTKISLGLKLSKKLVELSGGALSAFCDEAEGRSEFTVRLPDRRVVERSSKNGAKNIQISAINNNNTQGVGGGVHRKILIVDDNEDAAISLGNLVEKLGSSSVMVSFDGESALEKIRSDSPGLVFLDIGMPGMDGYEVAKRIRANPNSAIILVALTGYGQEEDKKRTREAGFDHHMTKPIALEDLKVILQV